MKIYVLKIRFLIQKIKGIFLTPIFIKNQNYHNHFLICFIFCNVFKIFLKVSMRYNNFQLCLSHCTEPHRTGLQSNLLSAAVGRFWRIDWSPAAEVSNYSKYYMLLTLTPFFIGRTHFYTTNFGIFFGQDTYIHCVAQETRIIKKLFIFFKFLIKKGRKRCSKFDN